MEGLLWLLGFAVLFYFMMRYGCGAHMVHGHHQGGQQSHEGAGGGRDPVCGMQVGPDAAYTKMHAGTRYSFCSKGCLDKFEAEPGKYVAPAAQGGGHAGGDGGHS